MKAAHGEEAPLVIDPFAGGGSIPLEALRLGCDAFASDLNPVACLILRVMLENIPRHGPKLAEELRRIGAEIKEQAKKELRQYYPPDADGAMPIAYLWARTVTCESTNCGAEIPLVRSFWLCKNASRLRALKYEAKRPKGRPPHIEFEVFQPKGDKQVPAGTVVRGNATCPVCERVLSVDRVRAQLRQQRGGADVVFDKEGKRVGGALLLGVVTLRDNAAGRQYRVAVGRDYESVGKAQRAVTKLVNQKLVNGLSPIPDEPLPPQGTLGFRVQLYGMTQWGNLFSARQKVAVSALVSAVRKEDSHVSAMLACAVNRVSMSDVSLTRWNAHAEKMQHTFGRQALPIVWDFCEVVPIADAPGNWESGYQLISEIVEALPNARIGQVEIADAASYPAPSDSSDIWFTDPPYYDAVPYADLSDFFFVWLRRALPDELLLRDPFDLENSLTPKTREIVQDETKNFEGQRKDRKFFENRMARSFAEGRRVLKDYGIGSVVFAHKTTEGWEALLSGMIKGGWTITGSWPIATEMASRLRARESAALATSVHLICRPRREEAEIGDWGEIFKELPNRIGDWMARLSSEGIRGADLVFACIGPAMELYSRYSKVEDAEGREIPLGGDPEASLPHERGFLAYVWEIVGRTALGQVLGTAEARARNGAAGALEEDARLTALFLWTIQSTSASGVENGKATDDQAEAADEDEDSGAGAAKKGLTLIYDVVRRFSQPLGIHLDTWEGRITETKKGIVRLLPVNERAEQLLGEDGASGVASLIERSRGGSINYRFGFMDGEKRTAKPLRKGDKRAKSKTPDEAPTVSPGTTTLDRTHIAMLLQKSGKSNALRTMLKSEIERGPDFLRLANALSALYPKDSEEKRLLDAMLLAMPR